jgi:hypothetical protein
MTSYIFRLILIWQLFYTPLAHAEYLVRAPQAAPQVFDTALAAHTNLQSWLSSTQAISPTPEQKEQLEQQLTKAQRAFLEDSLESAREQFKKVTAMALEADWDEGSRNAINFAYYRLAQLSENSVEQKYWLRRALIFCQEMRVDRASFPPPLVAAAQLERSTLDREALRWEPAKSFRGYEQVLINGRPVVIQEDLVIPLWPGSYRITAVSNVHAPFTQVLKADDLPDFRLNRPPLLSGSCAAPSWQAGTQKRTDLVAFYGEDCLKAYRNEQWVDLSPQPDAHKLDLQPHPDENALPMAAPGQVEILPPRHWYQNKWLWIGAAAVVVASVTLAVVNSQHRDAPAAEPTHQGPGD